MKQLLKSFLALSLVLSNASTIFADCSSDCGSSCNTGCETACGSCGSSSSSCDNLSAPCGPRSVFIPRSVGANTARELVGWQEFVHRFDVCEFYAVGALTFEYERSFKNRRIAEALFGSSTLRFQGSQVVGRESGSPIAAATTFTSCPNFGASCGSACSLVADYFGLATNSDITLNFCPRIENFILDFNLYVGLDEWLEGLYFRANLPVAHTRWSLVSNRSSCDNSCSNDCSNGCSVSCDTSCNNSCDEICAAQTCFASTTTLSSTPFPPCYMASTTVAAITSIEDALNGQTLFGDMQERWQFGRFNFCRQKKTALADIDLILGWDFWKSECGHFGLYLQAVAPTGNRPNARYLFSPIVGNGKHWELGGGVSAHWAIWEDDCDQALEVWLEGNVTHLFKTCSTRSFDFRNQGPLSRYMLLKEIDATGAYAGNLINAINFATRRIDTSFGVKGDVSVKLAYRSCGWAVDLGYNLYGRSKEKGCLKGAVCDIDSRTFGFKGTEGTCCRTFAFTGTAAAAFTLGAATGASSALNSTQSTVAGICAVTTPATADNAVSTIGATTVCLAWNSATSGTFTDVLGGVNPSGIIVAQTSVPPVTLTSLDLDINSGLACAELTSKVFGYVGYSWTDCGDHNPFFGIGAEGEFAHRGSNRTGLNKWGVFVKGGLTF